MESGRWEIQCPFIIHTQVFQHGFDATMSLNIQHAATSEEHYSKTATMQITLVK